MTDGGPEVPACNDAVAIGAGCAIAKAPSVAKCAVRGNDLCFAWAEGNAATLSACGPGVGRCVAFVPLRCADGYVTDGAACVAQRAIVLFARNNRPLKCVDMSSLDPARDAPAQCQPAPDGASRSTRRWAAHGLRGVRERQGRVRAPGPTRTGAWHVQRASLSHRPLPARLVPKRVSRSRTARHVTLKRHNRPRRRVAWADALHVSVSRRRVCCGDEEMVLAVYNERKASSSMTTAIVVAVVACCAIFVIPLLSVCLAVVVFV